MKRLIELALAPRLGILVRAACACAMGSLLVAVLIVLVPIPLLLVLGMGLAHVLGLLGILLYAIAVLREAFQAERRMKELQEQARQAGLDRGRPPHREALESQAEQPQVGEAD